MCIRSINTVLVLCFISEARPDRSIYWQLSATEPCWLKTCLSYHTAWAFTVSHHVLQTELIADVNFVKSALFVLLIGKAVQERNKQLKKFMKNFVKRMV